MSPVIVSIGAFEIRWYSLLMLVAIFIGLFLIKKEAQRLNLKYDFIFNMCFWAIIVGYICARLYYVLFNLDYYLKYPIEIFEVWNGGLAIHGGILFGLLTVIIYCKKYHAKTLKVLDILVVGLILGQAIGRWGNFFNGEAYGGITTLEHLQKLGLPEFIINGMYINGAYHQPTFIYESIWTFFGFLVLLVVRRYKYLKTGQLTGVYLVWYSVGRIIIEGMRTDSLMLGNFRVAQLVSGLLIILGILMIIFCKKGTRFDNLYKDEEKNDILF